MGPGEAFVRRRLRDQLEQPCVGIPVKRVEPHPRERTRRTHIRKYKIFRKRACGGREMGSATRGRWGWRRAGADMAVGGHRDGRLPW
jgi:hypothetical protein